MKISIDLDKTKGPLRLVLGVEYILHSSDPILISSKQDQIILYSRCIGNGTTEVYIHPTVKIKNDEVWLHSGEVKKIEFISNEFVLAEHLPDIVPAFIEEEYPLFRKLMEYYFKFIGFQDEPSGFIHSLEKFAHIDETFDEFREMIYREVLSELPRGQADRMILSKYILDFYRVRGTEDSISFLLYILTGQKPILVRRRDGVLIASNNKQGLLSNSGIVLQDNYCHQLFSYALYLKGEAFSKYKRALMRLVNPSGYLPFGVNLHRTKIIELPISGIEVNSL